MCELYAINAKRAVRANDGLRLFYQDSVYHPHGWGLSWREGTHPHLHKEEVRAIDSSYLRNVLSEPIESTNIVAHIRNATMGMLTYNNCHPFMRSDVTGCVWVIAHNGTILDNRLTDGYEAFAAGDTDSEQVVIYLVDELDDVAERKGAPLTFGERFVILSHAVNDLSASNKLNLVIDDGTYTYVHTNTVEPTLYVRTSGEAAIFCTRPLDDGGDWEPLPQNRLIAYRAGRMERMGARHEHSIDEAAYFAAIAGMTPSA
ncbi:MAG: class II glutamine amidotransferase [Atopobiaceae bacterium]|nr:class II glutamine amidotransferase [Atopobiaceae bacterium]